MSRGLIFKMISFLLIQVGDATENEENKTDGFLLQSQKVTQNPLTHNMPMCLNNEGR